MSWKSVSLVMALTMAGSAAQAAPFSPLSAAEKLAAGRAAGFAVKGRTLYNECEVPAAMIAFDQKDLNGDGKSELIVSDGGACYGAAGSTFTVLVKGADGKWKPVFAALGIPEVLKSAHLGWRDIEVGGPGMGRMPVARWNGKAYIER